MIASGGRCQFEGILMVVVAVWRGGDKVTRDGREGRGGMKTMGREGE